LSTHLRLGLPSGLFPSGFPTNIYLHISHVLVQITCISFVLEFEKSEWRKWVLLFSLKMFSTVLPLRMLKFGSSAGGLGVH
jgi:hypothetical protein